MSNEALTRSAIFAIAAGLACNGAIANSGIAPSSTFDADTAGQGKAFQTGFSKSQASSMKFDRPAKDTFTSVPEGWTTTTARTTTKIASNGTPVKTTVQTTSVSAPTGATVTTNVPASATATATAAAKTPAKKKHEDLYEVQRAQHIAPKAGWQVWEDRISMTNGQEGIPLVLTFSNGVGSRPGFQVIKLVLSGKALASEKDFQSNSLSLKMDNVFKPGDNKLIIQAYGAAGAELDWKLTSNMPVITKADPSPISTGQKLTITGRHFMANASMDQVSIGGKAAAIVGATDKSLEVTVPDDAPAGEQQVVVTVAGKASKAVKVVIRAVPVVTACDFVSTAPGQPITISGRGFAPTAGDNRVTIGGYEAAINSCSPTSINVTVPNMQWPAWYLPIKVRSFNVESTGNVTLNIQQRVIPNDGVPEQ